MVDAGPLRCFCCFSLCLCCRRQEGYQRVPNGALHRIGGGAIECHAVRWALSPQF
jgi:hypothetical protein